MILFCHGHSHGRIQFCFRRSAIGSQADLKSMQFMYTTPLAPWGVCVAPTSRRAKETAEAGLAADSMLAWHRTHGSADRSGGAVRAASREPERQAQPGGRLAESGLAADSMLAWHRTPCTVALWEASFLRHISHVSMEAFGSNMVRPIHVFRRYQGDHHDPWHLDHRRSLDPCCSLHDHCSRPSHLEHRRPLDPCSHLDHRCHRRLTMLERHCCRRCHHDRRPQAGGAENDAPYPECALGSQRGPARSHHDLCSRPCHLDHPCHRRLTMLERHCCRRYQGDHRHLEPSLTATLQHKTAMHQTRFIPQTALALEGFLLTL